MSQSPYLRTSIVVSMFVLSLMALPPAASVHNTPLFELDGNAIASGSTPGDDWSTLFPTNTSSNVFSSAWVAEPESNDTTYFSVSSKDINDISTWSVSGNSAPPKDEIVNAFAAAYNDSTLGSYIYFGADRWANNGDAAVGFWFIQGEFGIAPNGTVTGTHANNDTLVVSHFTNGGAVATIYVYKWMWSAPDHLVLIASGQDCGAIAAGDMACGKVNAAQVPSAVPYQGSGTKDPADQYPKNSFFEGGLNLTAAYGGNPPCFGSFVAETRSSQETTAVLKDIAFGPFNNCPVVPPEATLTLFKAADQPVVDLGDEIGFQIILGNAGGDPAEDVLLWDELPEVSGTWTDDSPDCSITGTNLTCTYALLPVGDFRYVNVSAGTADPDDCGPWQNIAFASANDGQGSNYAESDPADVYVTCADVGVEKTASDPVYLGGNVSFDIVVTSFGPDDAENVTLDDTLPAMSGSWSLSGADADDCSLTGDELSCDFGTVAVDDTRSITLTTTTGAASDCGDVDNTAFVSARLDIDASNDGSSDGTFVSCSDVSVEKDAADDEIPLGDDATFTITVTSDGPDDALDVTLTDELPDPPGGWSIVESDDTCAITDGTLECDFGTIPVGESRSVTITAGTSDAQTDCGDIDNLAVASAGVDLDEDDSSDNASIHVACADISVQKTGDSPVDVGDAVGFTIVVSSAGPDAAESVTLTDTLPDATNGWTLGGDDAADCSIDQGVLTCSFGDIPAGEDRSITLSTTSTLAECGDITNSVEASATLDISPSDNTDEAVVHVTCADVGVEKTASDPVIDVGEEASFDIVVTSYGPDDAENVTLDDTLPALAGGWTLSGPDAEDCELDGLDLACDFGTIDDGDTRSITLSGDTAVADCGPLDNTAFVDARIDTDPENNEDNASIYVTCADVGIEKTAADDTIDVGDEASFTIVVTSNGPDDAENVTLTDTLPAIDGGWTLSGDDADECSLDGLELACEFDAIPADSTVTVTASGTTALADCGDLDNTAFVAARLDTDPENDESSASIHVTCADVGVEKSATDDEIDVGDEASFSILVTSYGPDAAEDVSLTDTLPETAAGWTLGGDDADECDLDGLELTCDFGDLDAEETRSITLSSDTATGDCGTLDNSASVSARLDTNASNDEDSAQIYVVCADVGVQKSADETAVDVGDAVGFSLVVTSYGPDAAEDVTLTDTLPTLAGGWTLGGDDAADCELDGLELTCDFGDIDSGETRTVNVTGESGLDDCGLLDNTATVSARLDTNSENDEDGASIYVTCADVEINKTTPGDVDVGETASFDITVTSLGPDAAEDVVLTDELPSIAGGWTLSGDDAEDCDLDGDSLTCEFGTIDAGDSRTITLSGETSLTDCGDIANTAFVTATVNTNETNDESTASLHVTCADVGVEKTPDDETIDVGDTAEFTIVVTSYGPDAAEDVTLEDTLPALEGGWTLGGADADDCDLDELDLTCDFGTVDADDTRTISVSGETTLDDCGPLDNLANVSARLDTDAENNADAGAIYVTCADVGVQKSANDTIVDFGDAIGFAITVTSFGPDAAEDVELDDSLPSIAGGWTLGGDDADDCTLEGDELSCDFGDVPAGQTRTVWVSGIATLDDCGLLENTAEVDARLDTDSENNADDASIYVTCADVGLEKTAGDDDIDVGENATFTLTVTSFGPDAAPDVTLEDELPAGIAWALVAGDDSDDCDIVDGTLLCAFGEVPAEQTRSVTVTGETTLDHCDGVSNAAATASTLDSDPENNEAEAEIAVTCSDVGIEKSADGSQVVSGMNFTWILTITSFGPDAATGITVDDSIEAGTVLAYGGSAAQFCGEPSQNISCEIPELAPGESLVLEVTMSSAGIECGPIENLATAGADVDTNTSNDEDNASIEVICPFVTRTQGFWSTHTAYTQTIFDLVLNGTMEVGDGSHVRVIDTDGKLFGAWYSSISKKTTGQTRNAVDKARMVLLQQLVTAKLNCAAFGCSAATWSLITQADVAYAGTSKALMANLTAQLDAYNNGGDWVPLPDTYGPWNPATPDVSAALANRAFWNSP